ncbi:MAG: AAA family ATPase [Caldilineaceae bacterium]|nr:AAA family ATPase [Caldilineaceae bacterium]
MEITRVQLSGFRNFRDATIHFANKSLIIGPNEIGKSNLLYALRLILDPHIPEADLVPQDSDFYAFEDTNQILIIIKFENVVEDCVLAKFKQHVSDNSELYLGYKAERHSVSGRKSYKILVGRSLESLNEEEHRFYLRVLNLKFMDSKRDLSSFMRREKRGLLQDAKNERTESEISADNERIRTIEQELTNTRARISEVSYISKATEGLNSELSRLSVQSDKAEVVFDTGTTDTEQFIDNLKLASRVQGKTLTIGGDGKNNQIQLALWAARNTAHLVTGEEPLEINIFCIEEPEAHLHPHQQRRLATYLAETLQAQVLLTTHSPQIACEFPPNSIVRLFNNGPDTRAASSGSSLHIMDAFIEFGHRLNIIPAEAFFASVVFLVEGKSEELFYKALAQQIGVDLDKLNISILIVDGVGFLPYVNLLKALEIRFVVRTDNDIFKVPRSDQYRLAGVQRAIDICKYIQIESPDFTRLLGFEVKLHRFDHDPPPIEVTQIAEEFIAAVEKHDIFVAKRDLEHDLYDALNSAISDYLGTTEPDETIQLMKKRKATFMFEFLKDRGTLLKQLVEHSLTKPLLRCVQIVKEQP